MIKIVGINNKQGLFHSFHTMDWIILMKSFIRILKGSYFKSAAILATGSVVSQIIIVISSFALTRLYGPSELAVYAYILSVINTFNTIINANYNSAIVYEEDDQNVYALIKLSFINGLLFTVLISIGCYFYFVSSPSLNNYTPFTIIVFLNLLAYSMINIATSYNNRYREYKVMSTVIVVRSVIQNIGAVLLGFISFGSWGLLLPNALGQYAGLMKQSVILRQHVSQIYNTKFSSLKAVAKKHYRQPLFDLPSQFINSYSFSSITFFLETLYGLAELGYYSISIRLLGLPLSIISRNVGAILFKEAAEEQTNTGGFKRAYQKSLILLCVLSVPILLFMLLLGPRLSGILFGAGWQRAGVFIQLLAPLYAVRLLPLQ